MEPADWWPAGVAAITSRRVALATGPAVRVIESGPPDGPPVVLVHGWGVHAYLWRHAVPALAAAGHRVHAFDLPGHGLSDRPHAPGSYTVATMAGHLEALFDALGLDAAALVAQSMGGRIAVELTLRHPQRVRSLVLFGSVGFGEISPLVGLARYLPVPRGPLAGLHAPRWVFAIGKAHAYGRRAPVEQSEIDAYWAATRFPGYFGAMRQALIEFDWRALSPAVIARIAPPTLVVFGTRDRTVRPRRAPELAGALPRGEFRWVRDAGHVANAEAPEEVNPFLVEFVGRTR